MQNTKKQISWARILRRDEALSEVFNLRSRK